MGNPAFGNWNLIVKHRQENLQWARKASLSNIMSISCLKSTEMRLTWIVAALTGGYCLCWTWHPVDPWNAVNRSSRSVHTSLGIPICASVHPLFGGAFSLPVPRQFQMRYKVLTWWWWSHLWCAWLAGLDLGIWGKRGNDDNHHSQHCNLLFRIHVPIISC